MKIPETTKDKPYIKFTFDKNGDLLPLEAVEYWCGGINGGFVSSDGSSGNVCYPKQIEKYIRKFKENEIKDIEKQINVLAKKLSEAKKKWRIDHA